MLFLLYCVTCRTTGKIYIGYTTQKLQKRWRQHVWFSEGRDRSPNKFHLAIAQYGADDFEVIELHRYPTAAEALAAERDLILSLELIDYGLNSTEGGERPTVTAETRAKQSARKRGYKQTPEHIFKRTSQQWGKKRSLEAIEKTRRANTGKKHGPKSDEMKLRLRQAMLGQKRTTEQRLKYSAAQVRRWANWRAARDVVLFVEPVVG